MTAKNNVACPNCNATYSFRKSQLLNLKASPECKECETAIFPYFDQPFDDLRPEHFVHQLDRQMLDALKKIPGVDSVLRSLLRHSLELSMRLHHQGNFVQASPKQFKSLYKKLEHSAEILGIKTLPELYVVQDARVNAYTFGVEKCSIGISSSALDLLTDEEITSVLAHELGHIKAHHVLYKTASRILATLANSIAQKTLGVGGMMLYPLQIALLRWDRASELSSDRASLLVVKNPMVVLTTLMKLAGGQSAQKSDTSIDAFIEQAENYERTQEEGPLGKYIAVMNSMFTTHPFPIWRAREIIDWVNSGEYFKLLQGHTPETSTRECATCGSSISDNKECPRCSVDIGKDKNPSTDTIDKAWDSLKTWYDKKFNLPE